jgi:hypothetical protein
MNVGRGRRDKTAPSSERLKGIADYVVRRTSGMVSGGLRADLTSLSDDEQTEVVALTREAEEGGGVNFDRLSKKKQDRWERLVGKAAGDEKFFANHREMSEIASIAAEAHRASVRRPFRRSEESGLLQELGRQLEGHFLTVDMLAPLMLVFISLERGEAFAPQARVERAPDGEPVLFVSRAFGLSTERQDWRGVTAAWRQSLTHAEKNAWVEIDRAGNQWAIRLGARAKRAMRGDPPRKKQVA